GCGRSAVERRAQRAVGLLGLAELLEHDVSEVVVLGVDGHDAVVGRDLLHRELDAPEVEPEKVAAHDGIMAVHAEDHDLVQFMYEKFREEKQTDGWLLTLVHNKLSEMLAFRRTIQLAAHTGAGVHFVHTAAKEGVDAVAQARAKGLPIYAETLHHYACFTA